MAGITSYGAYIPCYRLSRADIAQAWGGAPQRGEKAIAYCDEDSITMAVAAARDCLTGIDCKSIDSLYFASTTFPYREKQSAAVVATATDLNREAFTVDFADTLRGGTNAMRVAVDAVNAKSAKNVLVCAADTRLGYPNGSDESSFGDGAAALLIGNTKVAVEIEGSYTLSNDLVDVWRSEKDTFVRAWEERFAREKGYVSVVAEAVSAALKKYKLTPQDFSKAVFYAASQGQLNALVRAVGFDPKTQVQDPLHGAVGNTGTASSLMCLVAALEDAKAGDRILLAGYSDGCDVFILKVTEEIENIRNRRGIKGNLAMKTISTSYQQYQSWRGLIETLPPARPPLGQVSAVALWRDGKYGNALYGVKCKSCGFIQFPRRRVCINCRAKDNFEDYGFADKIGNVFTFSHDNLAASVDPPTTIVAVDFPEGGRLMVDMTDRTVDEVKIGMPVEMTFRKVREVGGVHDYWWKCRPIRG